MKATEWSVVIWDNEEPTEVHSFSIERSSKGYTAAISLTYFEGRENQKLSDEWERRRQGKPKTPITRRASVERAGDWFSKGLLKEGLPHYQHASLWDFYRAVGYDYKKKRYAKEQPC